MPIELSRHIQYFIETCNGQIDVKVRDVKLHKSPVALKGLEIHLDVTFKIDSAKEDILHRLRDHIAQNYSTDRVEVPKAVVVDSVDSPALAGLSTDYGSGSDDSEEETETLPIEESDDDLICLDDQHS